MSTIERTAQDERQFRIDMLTGEIKLLQNSINYRAKDIERHKQEYERLLELQSDQFATLHLARTELARLKESTP